MAVAAYRDDTIVQIVQAQVTTCLFRAISELLLSPEIGPGGYGKTYYVK